jgi:mannose-6-phosphate isomerase
LFEPVLKDYIWGGRNLETRLGRQLPEGKEIAESWEIAAHDNGDVVVRNGPLQGTTLSELNERMGEALTGTRAKWAQKREKFPLLIKLLDANRELSVQVHPGDEYAQRNEGGELGKTEMWVVLHATDDAAVILGVKEGADQEKFRQAIEAGTLEQYLHRIPVQTGDFVCVPSGSLHAILGGLLIAEIQQNSDVTYRVYDWNRVGDDGKPRPLHVEQALDVINFNQVEPHLPQPREIVQLDGITRSQLCLTDYFSVERVEIMPGSTFEGNCDGETLEIWGTIEGQARLNGDFPQCALPAVQFALLPANMGQFRLDSTGGATLLRTTLP